MDYVERGLFREDLYYRLYVVPVHMPPLRDRGTDVIEIAEAALARFAVEEGKDFAGFAPETRDILLSHDWPGNVRQLLNVVRNVVCCMTAAWSRPPCSARGAAPVARPAAAAAPAPALPTAGLTLAQIERQAIEDAIARHGGSVPLAARELDVAPSTLYRKLEGWAPGASSA